jgi:hypothetical protein
MYRRLMLLAVSLAGVVCALGAVAAPAHAAPAHAEFTTLPGFNNVRPVFQQNGFRPFKSTYVRCYTDRGWRQASNHRPHLMGFYRHGSWINVRGRFCTNALKALKGQTNTTNVVALSTLMHETIHRQGVRDEAKTECLSHWMTAHGVKAWTGSERKALSALGRSAAFAKRSLPARYQMSNAACGRLAARWGVQAIAPPPPPPPPAPPAPTPPAPLSVVFDETYTWNAIGNTGLPPSPVISSARRVEITFTAPASGVGFWSCVECYVRDMSNGRTETHYAGFGVLKPGETHSVTADNLSGSFSLVSLVLSSSPGYVWEWFYGGPIQVTKYPDPITIRVVAYGVK